jgi:tetratricopeptide (TPR) repeat protein
MKFQFLNALVLSEEIFQNAILRITTGNISRKRSRERLIEEHKKLNYFGDINKYIVHNICSQPNLNLNLELRTSIENLQIDHIPTEKFLLCRVITGFTKINALLTLVEDPEGNVERLALYNWTSLPKNKENMDCRSIDQSFLPVGTLLVIKNLSYKVAADNNTIIYSDNPDDVTIIDHHNNKLLDDLKWSTDLFNEKEVKMKTVDDFHCYGDNYFALNYYTAAIDEYSNGIKLEPQNVSLLANRAEAFLRLSQFRNALDDVETVLEYEPDHLKAAFRKGKALCYLKRYQESITTLQDLHQRMKANTDDSVSSIKKSTEQLLKHVKILAYENKNGEYDYTRIINEFYERTKIRKSSKDNIEWVYKTGPRLDHAEFLCEDIEIRSVEGKGRGWIAKCDIPENTLLMVSKAFSIVYSHEVLGHNMQSNISNDQTTCIASSLCTEELITCITQKLLAEPYHLQEVYQLYNGLNLDKTDKINEHLVNVDIIGNIVKYNSFALNNNIIIENAELSGLGLWILPSYFNHSCIDENVAQFFIGDLMFMRSLRPISKGEELMISYRSADNRWELRTRYLKSIGIDCRCRLCNLDESEDPETNFRRYKLLNTFEKLIRPRILDDTNPSLIKRLEKILSELHSIRKEHPDLEFDTLELSKILSFAYRKNGKPTEALSISKEVYKLYKNFHLQVINFITLDIVLLYIDLKQMEEARKWFDILLKRLAEPILGKFKDDEAKWKEEAFYLMEKIFPVMNSTAKLISNNNV